MSFDNPAIERLLGGKKYGIVSVAGDPFVRHARARLIWANNTAQAVQNLGVPAMLAGQVTRLPVKFESREGLISLRRMMSGTYNLPVDFDLAGLYSFPSKFGKLDEDRWARDYDIPRSVFPYCGLLHTRDPRVMQKALLLGLPCIYEDHDEDHNKGYKGLPDLVARHENLWLIIAITDAVRQRLLEDGIPDDRIMVLDSGFNRMALERDAQDAATLRRRLLRGWKHLVVYAGGLHEERGIDHLLTAAGRMPDTKFILCGGNKGDQAEWRERAAAAGLGNIVFPGYLPQAEALRFQQAACAVVMTRRDDPRAAITSPLKFFEYLASGTAVVAAQISAITRHVEAGLAVSTYAPGAPESLADVLRASFRAFPWTPEGYGENTRFASKFTWEERQRAIFDRLLKS